VLVLSHYAGAAEQLIAAVLTNPFHPEGLASDIDLALRMPAEERHQRHHKLAAVVTGAGGPVTWAAEFLHCLARSRTRRPRAIGW
jgi:trehalose 6-phosphate synthase